MDAGEQKYLELLYKNEGEAQDNYDKTILSLSSGALGISFAFVSDIAGSGPIVNSNLLISSWICWGVSVLSVLTSFLMSNFAHRRAIKEFQKGVRDLRKLHGFSGYITGVLNISGGILFLVGLILIFIFVNDNM